MVEAFRSHLFARVLIPCLYLSYVYRWFSLLYIVEFLFLLVLKFNPALVESFDKQKKSKFHNQA